MVKFIKNKSTGTGPSSAIGIMRFFDANTKSPQLNPYFVMATIIIIVVGMIVLQMMM
ncbi:MAG: preprotein translocase subunit Sec61beta [Candidatus Diapherotrites archaeon]|jgi:preprotein translocase subunit Sec61beta|uniref:Preprotein translocase subunit Sec61beta n=1 Tax=Candidatus Iainarchaeum sp. TaxID=3101447 RepID=A0A7K4BZG5_9ARCH|nr:preprotein translocase subunit Sec61beta [Candidatus Diapherotrites archaeon]